ncbi:MAG: hypothetical protein AAF737_04175 [Pseudomonadota bacterium]
MEFLLVWFGVGIVFAPLAYARTLAEFQRGFPAIASVGWRGDKFRACVFAFGALVHPPSLIIPMFLGTHGFMWRWRNPHKGASNE